MLKRRPLSFVLVALVTVGCLFAPAPATACKTSCALSQAPNCIDCGFLAFSRIVCLRVKCDECWEVECYVAQPPAGDRLAAEPLSCSDPAPQEVERTKVVKVEVLAARS
jgi:hypothetical protein